MTDDTNTDQAAPELLPNWEAFGLAIMEDWATHGDIDAADKFDLAVKFGILRPIVGGFNPDVHDDEYGCTSPGDPWFMLNRRADLVAPSAPADVEGLAALTSMIEQVDAIYDSKLAREARAELTALQAENERLQSRAEKAEAERGAWKANAETLANALRHAGDTFWDHICDDALASHAKLKGDA